MFKSVFAHFLPLSLAALFSLQSVAHADFDGLKADAKIISTPFTDNGDLTTDSDILYECDEEDCSNDVYAKAYKITLTSRQKLGIWLGSEDFDTYLYVFDENGDMLLLSGNISENSEYNYSRINSLLDAGTYYILASAPYGFNDGTYEIGVRVLPPASHELIAAATSITSLPYTQTSSLTTSSLKYENEYGDERYAKAYKITLTSRQKLDISLGSDAFDTYLYVVDEQGYLINDNDDESEGSSDSFINYTFSAGTYYILASTYSDDAVGAYKIGVKKALPLPIVAELDAAATGITTPITETGNLTESSYVYEYFDEVTYEIKQKYANIYKITLVDDQDVTIQLRSEDFDSYLYVFDEYGDIVAFNDDYEDGSYIEGNDIAAGTYYILVSTYCLIGEDCGIALTSLTGAYTIEVTSTGETPVAPPPAVIAKASPLKAYTHSGTLYLSGLTEGKTWGIYTAKGTLLQSGIANSAEMNVKMNAANGVYFVRSNGQTLKIINK